MNIRLDFDDELSSAVPPCYVDYETSILSEREADLALGATMTLDPAKAGSQLDVNLHTDISGKKDKPGFEDSPPLAFSDIGPGTEEMDHNHVQERVFKKFFDGDTKDIMNTIFGTQTRASQGHDDAFADVQNQNLSQALSAFAGVPNVASRSEDTSRRPRPLMREKPASHALASGMVSSASATFHSGVGAERDAFGGAASAVPAGWKDASGFGDNFSNFAQADSLTSILGTIAPGVVQNLNHTEESPARSQNVGTMPGSMPDLGNGPEAALLSSDFDPEVCHWASLLEPHIYSFVSRLGKGKSSYGPDGSGHGSRVEELDRILESILLAMMSNNDNDGAEGVRSLLHALTKKELNEPKAGPEGLPPNIRNELMMRDNLGLSGILQPPASDSHSLNVFDNSSMPDYRALRQQHFQELMARNQQDADVERGHQESHAQQMSCQNQLRQPPSSQQREHLQQTRQTREKQQGQTQQRQAQRQQPHQCAQQVQQLQQSDPDLSVFDHAGECDPSAGGTGGGTGSGTGTPNLPESSHRSTLGNMFTVPEEIGDYDSGMDGFLRSDDEPPFVPTENKWDTKNEPDKVLPVTKAVLKRKRKPKIYSNPVPSNHCHICARSRGIVELLTCHNLKNGTCLKVICDKCFTENNWDWTAASTTNSEWICCHCTNECPARAQCNIYRKTNDRRRMGSLKKRKPKKTAPDGKLPGAPAIPAPNFQPQPPSSSSEKPPSQAAASSKGIFMSPSGLSSTTATEATSKANKSAPELHGPPRAPNDAATIDMDATTGANP